MSPTPDRIPPGRIRLTYAVEGAPDLMVEILSTSSVRQDRTTKAALYGRFGVPHYWIVDPDVRTMEIYELDAELYRLVGKHAGEAIVRTALFPCLEIPLADLWS
ncbi:MAG: Uma2 family endonuclease [Candidatus Binatia bacterium]